MDLTKLSAAKLWIISDPKSDADDAPRGQTYLAHALFALIPIDSARIPRATVDEHWRLYVNSDWLAAATVTDVAQELTHLVWHLLNDHASRARSLRVDASNAGVWNASADAALQQQLEPCGLAPRWLTSDATLTTGLTAEEYYASLTQRGYARDGSDVGCGSGVDGVSRDFELPPSAPIGGMTKVEADVVRRKVAIEYRESKKGIGDEWDGAARWAHDILEPSIAWEPLLAAAIRSAVSWTAGRGDFTYRRPSRRNAAVRDVVLPGQHRPVPRIAIVIDTSASVDDDLLGRALGEVDQLVQSLNLADDGPLIYSVDAAAHTAQRVRRAKDIVLLGAGGTDMRVGIEAALLERPTPDVIVVFTDGYTPWPAESPRGASVVVALLGDRDDTFPDTPTWAQRIECRIDR